VIRFSHKDSKLQFSSFANYSMHRACLEYSLITGLQTGMSLIMGIFPARLTRDIEIIVYCLSGQHLLCT
jgi:hypothetical protein